MGVEAHIFLPVGNPGNDVLHQEFLKLFFRARPCTGDDKNISSSPLVLGLQLQTVSTLLNNIHPSVHGTWPLPFGATLKSGHMHVCAVCQRRSPTTIIRRSMSSEVARGGDNENLVISSSVAFSAFKKSAFTSIFATQNIYVLMLRNDSSLSLWATGHLLKSYWEGWTWAWWLVLWFRQLPWQMLLRLAGMCWAIFGCLHLLQWVLSQHLCL